jgi:hypothetical protein
MKGGSTTRVDAVLKTLVEGLPACLPGGVDIVEGDQPIQQPDDALILAPADPDTPGIVVTYAETKTRQPAEQIEIALVARSYSGDPDMSARRKRCADIVAGVQDYIRKNPRVEDRWDQIEIGPNAYWHPVYTDAGCNCYVGFSLVTIGLL